ncbi:dihydrodipicolinate synthase family protein [Halotia wernerae UHCC 0503]|nr:dihydrodipicolinate synthase family protein [Halotia wernerae UHCC 0503]
MPLEGILTATVTPFDDEGLLDLKAYDKLLDFVLEKGVHYIVPCGTTGEYYALTLEERKSILNFVSERVGSRARLIAGTNCTTTKEVIELSQYAKELGYEAVMLASPFCSLPTITELVAHFREVEQAINLPILLYNNPGRTAVDMNIQFLEGVQSISRIFGIKESSNSLTRMHEVLMYFGNRFEIVCGSHDQALEYFLWGSRSWVAGISTFLPTQIIDLYEVCVHKRDFEVGIKKFKKLLPLFALMEGGGKFIQYCKYGCELANIPVGSPRPPLMPLSQAEKQQFELLYAQAIAD